MAVRIIVETKGIHIRRDQVALHLSFPEREAVGLGGPLQRSSYIHDHEGRAISQEPLDIGLAHPFGWARVQHALAAPQLGERHLCYDTISEIHSSHRLPP